jgi:hypothetical protein
MRLALVLLFCIVSSVAVGNEVRMNDWPDEGTAVQSAYDRGRAQLSGPIGDWFGCVGRAVRRLAKGLGTAESITVEARAGCYRERDGLVLKLREVLRRGVTVDSYLRDLDERATAYSAAAVMEVRSHR